MTIKKTYHHGDLRQNLMDTAALMLREEGEAALSMRKLADRVGVSRTAAYHYFKDKQDLLCAVAEEGFRRFSAVNARVSDVTSLHRYLSSHVRGYVSFAVKNSEYYDLMFSGHIWKSDSLTTSLKQQAYRSFRNYAEQIAVLCEAHTLPSGISPLRFSQVTWSTLHGLSRLLIDGIYVDQAAIASICDATISVLLQNIDTPKVLTS